MYMRAAREFLMHASAAREYFMHASARKGIFNFALLCQIAQVKAQNK